MIVTQKKIARKPKNDYTKTIPKVGSEFRYSEVVFDKYGWADATQYLPADYDLLSLRTKKGIKNGWRSGNIWDGMRIDLDDEVTHWKRKADF